MLLLLLLALCDSEVSCGLYPIFSVLAQHFCLAAITFSGDARLETLIFSSLQFFVNF